MFKMLEISHAAQSVPRADVCASPVVDFHFDSAARVQPPFPAFFVARPVRVRLK
jgi:hypothetical protein